MKRFLSLLAMFAVLAVLVSACSQLEGDGRHLVPLSQDARVRLSSINATAGSGMLVRIFKNESELEVWKETSNGEYALFSTYEICAWSGELGPKLAEGDRQSPEGFSTITPGLMNPRSSYYLAFNTGFPNKFDRAFGRTGSELMVHGDCSSRGCYAMTDEQIAEIYALARESFSAGNRSFQLQIFPFRMTIENMVANRDNPNMSFWRNLKEGYDHFEVTHRPVDWDVCGRRYVFNTVNPTGRALDARQACPADLTVEPTVMALVAAKQARDENEFNQAVHQIEVAEAQAVVNAAEREREAALRAEREAAFNESMESVGDSVADLFGDLFQPAQPTAADPEGPDQVSEGAGTAAGAAGAPAQVATTDNETPPEPASRAGTPGGTSGVGAPTDPFAEFLGNLFGGGADEGT